MTAEALSCWAYAVQPVKKVPWSLFLGAYHEEQYWSTFRMSSLLYVDSIYVFLEICKLAAALFFLPALNSLYAMALVLLTVHTVLLTLWQSQYIKWRVVVVSMFKVLVVELLHCGAWASFGGLERQPAEVHLPRVLLFAVLLGGQVVGMQLPILLQVPLQFWSVTRLLPVVVMAVANTCMVPEIAESAAVRLVHSILVDFSIGPLQLFGPSNSFCQATGEVAAASDVRSAVCSINLFVMLVLGCLIPLVCMYMHERRNKKQYLAVLLRRPFGSQLDNRWLMHSTLALLLLWHLTGALWIFMVMHLDLCRITGACSSPLHHTNIDSSQLHV